MVGRCPARHPLDEGGGEGAVLFSLRVSPAADRKLYRGSNDASSGNDEGSSPAGSVAHTCAHVKRVCADVVGIRVSLRAPPLPPGQRINSPATTLAKSTLFPPSKLFYIARSARSSPQILLFQNQQNDASDIMIRSLTILKSYYLRDNVFTCEKIHARCGKIFLFFFVYTLHMKTHNCLLNQVYILSPV